MDGDGGAWFGLRSELRQLMERQLVEQEALLARHLLHTRGPAAASTSGLRRDEAPTPPPAVPRGVAGDTGAAEEGGGCVDSSSQGTNGLQREAALAMMNQGTTGTAWGRASHSMILEEEGTEAEGFVNAQPSFLPARALEGLQDDRRSSTQTVASFVPQAVSHLKTWIESIEEPERTGPLARVLASMWFDVLLMATILCNCVLIVVTSNHSMENPGAEPTAWMQVLETLFALVYLVEIGLKVATHRLFFFCNADWKWNLVDFVMAASALVDIVFTYLLSGKSGDWHFLRVLRVFKVVRSMRLLRVLRGSRELRAILDGLMGCTMTMMWSAVILGSILCITSVFFVQRLSASLVDQRTTGLDAAAVEAVEVLAFEFRSVQHGMLALFKAATGGEDWGPYVTSFWIACWIDGGAFLLFIGFFTLAVMNVVMSIFLDRAMSAAQPDDREIFENERRKDRAEADEFGRHFSRMDQGTGLVTREAFVEHMREDPCLKQRLGVRGLSIGDPGLFFDMVVTTADEQGRGGVRADTLARVCMGLRGSATSLDLSILSYQMWKVHAWHQHFEKYCIEQLQVLARNRPPCGERENRDDALVTVLQDILTMGGARPFDHPTSWSQGCTPAMHVES